MADAEFLCGKCGSDPFCEVCGVGSTRRVAWKRLRDRPSGGPKMKGGKDRSEIKREALKE